MKSTGKTNQKALSFWLVTNGFPFFYSGSKAARVSAYHIFANALQVISYRYNIVLSTSNAIVFLHLLFRLKAQTTGHAVRINKKQG